MKEVVRLRIVVLTRDARQAALHRRQRSSARGEMQRIAAGKFHSALQSVLCGRTLQHILDSDEERQIPPAFGALRT
jgi:hypothetical protein